MKGKRRGSAQKQDVPRVGSCVHCWHAHGTLITDGLAQTGTVDCQCCQCGLVAPLRWHTQTRRLKGHGPFATYTTMVYEEPVYGND